MGRCPALLRPLLTSRSALRRRPFRHEARSPQVRVVTFPAQPPDLRRLPLVARASRSLARSPWSAPPPIRFLFVGSRFRSPLLSALPLGHSPCGSLGVAATSFPKGLSPPGHAHAGHTSKNRPGLSPACSSSPCPLPERRCRPHRSFWCSTLRK